MRWLIPVALALAGCAKIDPFACETDDQCAPGRCEATGACSFADVGCHSGWRYGNRSSADVAGVCVGAESGPIVSLAAGGQHACAAGADGRAWCWGNDKYGGLGRPGPNVTQPVPVDGVGGVRALAGGAYHTCALGDGHVWCWGADAQGELGRGDATPDPVPDPAPVVALADAAAISLGAYVSCALDTGGGVWCWGRGKDGEDGQASTSYQWEPVTVGVPASTAIAAGGQEGCAIATTGEVWCWGNNDSGQLGVPGNGRTKPTAVPAFAGAVQIAVGAAHACARFADGHVLCTGDDSHGQLGDGQSGGDQGATSSHTPVQVVGLTDAVDLAALDATTCARKQGGGVVCWGEGDHGELGVGLADASTPGAPLPLPRPAVSLTAGQSFACAMTDDGCLWCWGDDSTGQLGDGPGSPGGIRPVLLGTCAEPPP
jgi:alpha-tubulin suppressor-like RCC1 family protein